MGARTGGGTIAETGARYQLLLGYARLPRMAENPPVAGGLGLLEGQTAFLIGITEGFNGGRS